ncbi:hypothetical protein BJV85_000111 [Clostridium acetobutylicum]|uniref:Lipoprotein n=1 Tax=Clostridium acetobutylicum (strain ATCC 824 / DSM 792 / JCM 1419 / IAM 19013 / LMG 5710 / NBRC 13948 / NRRL B-527 / VKM B-1787 / 2291 / W) TaxID=272562 RepID=Q97MZ0_CLOAB|nr:MULTISPECIES: hypothetical protein [Clostridium]AAK78036.1 Hypothetical protein, CF-17 family [Clostridium acetobutylicum ATCC 824]ADZ19092.1 conserved hypothetical protein [Clostridium acetobutylicum EA 2018]AEI31032.1 hypothetical protein SMB_G0049 [Clostridium acetobutylicum DSM 1731]AWV81901.1 hypothetical protein DK921_17810 [Clostridium acetobutylicum]MBC2395451.1 hypothetical protein [Clostridium acetobutylicum]
MKKNRIKIIVAILGVVTVVTLAGCDSANKKSVSTKNTKSTSAKRTKKDESIKKDKYTYDDFKKVKIGMTYNEAKKILGEGNKESDILYTWRDSEGGEIDIVYNDGKASNVKEERLDKDTTKVTHEQYDKIQSNQTYDDVKAIFGTEGTVIEKGYNANGNDDNQYIWGNEEDGYIKVSFGDGKTSLKSDGTK